MGWQVHGDIDAGFRFDVNDSGLVVSGVGRHFYQPSAKTDIDMSTLDELPAEWSIYRASEARRAAGLMSLDLRDMKRYIDEANLKATDKPICIIKKYDTCVGFDAFLPDHCFSNALEVLKLIAGGIPMKYWFIFEFIGFLPRQVAGETDFVSYSDWLEGRPYVCKGDDSFMLRAQQLGPGDRPSVPELTR